MAFFPILSNMTLGLNSTDHNLRDLFRIYGATRWQRLRFLQLPSALPYFLGGLRIAGGLSLIGAIVAEYVAGTGGIGSGLAFRILEAGYRLNIPRMFAALVLIAGLGGGDLCRTVIPVAYAAAQMARECDQTGMTMDFKTLPPGPVTLANVTVPACLLGQAGDLVRTSLPIAAVAGR